MRVYCDHAASSPLRDEAWQAMAPLLRAIAGNPSAPHAEGRAARAALEAARAAIAGFLGSADVVLTGGGSEAANLAVLGRRGDGTGRIVTTPLEHPAVARAAEAAGEVALAPLGADGVVALDGLAALVRPGDRLCAVTWASNLTGAIQPVAAIAELCAARGVPLHLDAVQAAPWIALRVDELPGEVTASIAAHKLGGPVGIGALAGRGVPTLAPALHGGGQERGLRPGTQGAALAAGFAAALAAPPATTAIAAIRDAYERALCERLDGIELLATTVSRLPGHSLALIDGVRGDALCALLDDAGFATSAGSACHSSDPAPEAALAAMDLAPDRARSALRASFGHGNGRDDASALARAVAEGATALRAASTAVLG